MTMDDQTLETLCSEFDQAVTICSDKTQVVSDQTMETQKKIIDRNETVKLEVENELVDSSGLSDTSQVMNPPDNSQVVAVKLDDLSTKVQIIRKEHAVLCDEVKGFTAQSLLNDESLEALQKLSTENERLKKKCLEECLERKKLYNEVIELKGNIRVFCRCRPMKQDEVANGSTSTVEFDSSLDNELHIVSADSSKKQFKFDHVFRPGDDQEAVFVQTQPIVTSVLDGYNVCIFAYGQTGTGKTYTMEGTPENRGVNYRTLEELFKLSSERSSIMKYELFVSMLEVYNEKIRDLLLESSNQPAKKLEIKQSAEGTQEVPGLVETKVHGTSEVWDLLTLGSQARSVGSTNANELSSRSHSLLRVTVVGENLINGQRTKSRLWLVDLAGSERVGRIEVEGDRLKESQFINKSLSALGDVISALALKSSHVPYRNSKLTHMLQSSLGGDCKSLMFVQISPSTSDLGETLCSLNFASRVRGVEHGPVRKQADQAEFLKYKQLAEKAKQDEKETKRLQDSLQSLQLRFAARETICKNLQEKVRDLETQLEEERKRRLKQENRALATISLQSNQPQKTTVDKKPPVAPTKLRLPLRRISNVMPPNPTQTPAFSNKNKSRMSFLPVVEEDKENNGKQVLKPRRSSIAVRPQQQPQPTNQFFQPKRRASIAILRPEPNSNVSQTSQFFQPKRRASVAMFRPDSNVNVQETRPRPTKGVTGRSSNIWRTFSVASPSARDRSTVEATPIGPRSSKFRGSPPSAQVGSWRPKHPTVIALQKKQLVWSPLKVRSMMKQNRKT